MSQGIIDFFEVIDINHEKCGKAVRISCAKSAGNLFLGGGFIVKSGKGVFLYLFY